MPTITVSTPIPFIGDPEIFEVEPFIVLAGKPVKIEYDSHETSLRELFRHISEINNQVFEEDIAPAQKKSVFVAAALRVKHPGASNVFVSKTIRPLVGAEWGTLLPLVYAAYTDACVAAKKSEDPVVIFKRRFLKAKSEHVKTGGLKKAALTSSVTDVISHAVGRLTVVVATSLRRRDTYALATYLNTFSNLVLALLEHDEEVLKLHNLILQALKKGYRGCAYIPTLETLVEI